ncbi:MAG: class I SAM-dependent methyltransferase [Candidatus Competibacterales bacterium]
MNLIHQETEGLLSPVLRDIRLRQVSFHIEESSTILDMACVAGYLSRFLPVGCRYYGVDRVPASNTNEFTSFLHLDVLANGSFERIRDWLPQSPDYVTCIAFLEHIENPAEFVEKCSRLLASNGKFIGTTPHPRGRIVHDLLSRVHLCSRQGAEEHERFLGKEDIERIARTSKGSLSRYSQFLLSLNQLFVIEYPERREA